MNAELEVFFTKLAPLHPCDAAVARARLFTSLDEVLADAALDHLEWLVRCIEPTTFTTLHGHFYRDIEAHAEEFDAYRANLSNIIFTWVKK